MRKFKFSYILLYLSSLIISCSGQSILDASREAPVELNTTPTGFPQDYDFTKVLTIDPTYPELDGQISTYVRRIFQDKDDNLWFGSNGYGVSRYDGDTLVYFSTYEGLAGAQVTGIIEDREGHLWVATNGGVSRYDGESFTSFTTKEGLSHNRTWSIFEDSKGTIWVGTVAGVCRFDGTQFRPFALPEVDAKEFQARCNTKLARCIMEDKAGNMWFGMDGIGAFKYDGQNFTHFTKNDGLCDNSIVCILEDRNGHFWFSSMFGGLSRYDGQTYTTYSMDNYIGNNEVWTMHEDKVGNIWCSSERFGLYRYDGEKFTNFSENEGLGVKAVQTIYEDRQDRFWVGGGGGLYRLEGERFVNVKSTGPWE